MCQALVAYIDPGSGSILLQVILAALIGSISLCYRRIARLAGAVFRLRESREPPAAGSDETISSAAYMSPSCPAATPAATPADDPAARAS